MARSFACFHIAYGKHSTWRWIVMQSHTPESQVYMLEHTTPLKRETHVACIYANNRIAMFIDGRPVTADLAFSRASDAVKKFPNRMQVSLTNVYPQGGTVIGNCFSGYSQRPHPRPPRPRPRRDMQNSLHPRKRLDSDKHTLALFRFEQETGTWLKDESPQNHYGEIHGAKWIPLNKAPADPPPIHTSEPPGERRTSLAEPDRKRFRNFDTSRDEARPVDSRRAPVSQYCRTCGQRTRRRPQSHRVFPGVNATCPASYRLCSSF